MTTAGRIIESALDKLSIRGAGQTVGGNDLAHCLRWLNIRCSTMKLGPGFAFTQLETVLAVAAGVSSLTIGLGMQLNIARPQRLESSSFTRVGGIDHPLEVTNDRARYNAISQKTNGGAWPEIAFYDGGNPTGRVYLWPQAACELHAVTRVPVGSFADVTTEYTLPDGYEELLIYDLAETVAPDFEVVPLATVTARARELRRLIKRSNHYVPQLDVGPERTDPQSAFLGGE